MTNLTVTDICHYASFVLVSITVCCFKCIPEECKKYFICFFYRLIYYVLYSCDDLMFENVWQDSKKASPYFGENILIDTSRTILFQK